MLGAFDPIPHASRCLEGLPLARGGGPTLSAVRDLVPGSKGFPLSPRLRAALETLFHTDFADVRIHIGPEPLAVGAHALACGDDLWFAPGEYEPHTLSGLWLLAHELTHVLQQRAGQVHDPRGAGWALVDDPALEAEAERMGLLAVLTLMPAEAKAAGLPSREHWLSLHEGARGVASPGHTSARRATGGAVIQPGYRHKYLLVPRGDIPPKFNFLIAKIIKLFDEDKAARKKFAEDDVSNFKDALKTPGNAHPVLHSYEKNHLQHGANWWKFVEEKLLVRCKNQIWFSAPPETVDTQNDILTIYAWEFVEGHTYAVPIADIHFGLARFEEVNPQPRGVLHKVYQRVGVAGGRHYVRLSTSDTYVKRFVMRGLNQTDAYNLGKLKALQAPNQDDKALIYDINVRSTGRKDNDKRAVRHPVTLGTSLTIEQQILSHTRGWQKRFVSTGVSKQPPVSTRGEEFISVFGTAIIDLAKVPQDSIYDIHAPRTAEERLGVTAKEVIDAPAPSGKAGYANEKFLAMRDVIRTRELLIKKEVPFAAVRAVSDGARIVGLSNKEPAKKGDDLDVLYGLDPSDWDNKTGIEQPSYPWNVPGSRGQKYYWGFVQFATEVAAKNVHVYMNKRLDKGKGQERLLLHVYKPDRPDTGMT